MARPFRLEPVTPEESNAFYRYHAVPFRLAALPDADSVEILLVFYGSAWYDMEFEVTRFCGKTEIDPAMPAEIVQHVTHAYVVGVKPEKIKEEYGAE